MQTKLTLRLDEELIEQAKEYAAEAGKSVSQIVADYFALLRTTGGERKPAGPVTASLRGVLKEKGGDESAYRDYLAEKYR